jgi:putative spermidine/putrescine transport system substrate-binding protein
MLRRFSFVLASTAAIALAAGAARADDAEAAKFRDDFLAGKLGWADVQARAKQEGQVNFYHWGGNDDLNVWTDSVVGPAMAAEGVKLSTKRLAGTKEAIDLVIAEANSGRGIGQGSVDMIWVNGENFYTLKRQNMLFGAFADKLPNSVNFEWDPADPRSQLNTLDFGVETNMAEVPWSGQQYVCAVNRAYMKPEETPSTFEDLYAWLEKNPGKFTYVKPPQATGNTFVQAAMYAFNPDGNGAEPFQKSREELGAAEIARLITPGMEYLKRLEPLLLGGAPGKLARHPENNAAGQAMFRNSEINMLCLFGLYTVAVQRNSGGYPETAEEIIFPKGLMIKNKNYLVIPSNAPNPAAALVLANHMSSIDSQVSKLKMIGYPSGVDAWRLSEADQQRLKEAEPPHFGVTAAELDANIAPDTNASLVDVIEGVWLEYIERQSSEPIAKIVENVMAGLK